MKYVFSGHESFTCKTLWLKKGYDFITNQHNFNAPDAVVKLGVGKNMVASIRYWMRAFGMTDNDELTEIAHYLLNTENGKDPYIEDLATLWLLHFLLIKTKEATLYNLLFLRLQREKKQFDRDQIMLFVKRIMTEADKQNQFNENTLKKDIATLILNYVLPQKTKAFDDYASLLIDLELIRHDADNKSYLFNIEGKRPIPWEIFLYAIIKEKGEDKSVSYDVLQNIGLIFCMNDMEIINMCKEIETHHGEEVRYSDTAGIRQLQFIKELDGVDVLNEYYG